MATRVAWVHKESDVKVEVDFGRCTGLGICESLAPEFFEVDETGTLVVLREDVSAEELKSVEEAVAGCPTEALRLSLSRSLG